MTTFTDLARANYMQLTTVRKSGVEVQTPVWVAGAAVGDGEDAALIVITPAESGKVKRVRHTPRVTLRPCSMTGRVKKGTEPISGIAEIVTDAAGIEAGVAALRRKYGWQFRMAFGRAKKTGDTPSYLVLRITEV